MKPSRFVDSDPAGTVTRRPSTEGEVLMDVQSGSFLGERRKPERLQPSSQTADVARPGSSPTSSPERCAGTRGGEDEPPFAPAMTAPTTTAATASIARVSRFRARGVSFVIEVTRGSPANARKRIDRPDDRREE